MYTYIYIYALRDIYIYTHIGTSVPPFWDPVVFPQLPGEAFQKVIPAASYCHLTGSSTKSMSPCCGEMSRELWVGQETAGLP